MSFSPRTNSMRRSSLRRSLALVTILTASFAVLNAQTSQPVSASQTQAAPTLNLQLPVASISSSSLSSISTDNEVAINAAHFNFVDAMQYGGRPRYGRPRYRGGNTNSDGSAKYIGFGAAGFTQPIGDTYHLLTPDYGIEVGGGRQFSKHFALPIQFDYDSFNFTRANLGGQAYIYTGDGAASDNGIDANSHIWSFTVDPTYTFYQGKGVGAYVVAGVGFYHKVANFTAPQTGFECGYYGCGDVTYQGNFDHYTSNAPGFNGGFGLKYKVSHFSNQELFGEVRYVFVDNSQRSGLDLNNYAAISATYTGTDFYPANSNRTTYIPVKFGIRF